MKVQITAFAAINHNGRKPYIMAWSTRAQASQVRSAVVDNWPRRDGVRQTWESIRRQGISVSKVQIWTTP